ncbi:MAG: hypothetical protein GKR77_00985 [Legionellales bacterium]|nr:hypothetical protein [Legionellales bacterium]
MQRRTNTTTNQLDKSPDTVSQLGFFIKQSEMPQEKASTPTDCVKRHLPSAMAIKMIRQTIRQFDARFASSVEYIPQASRDEVLKMMLYMSKRISLSTIKPDIRIRKSDGKQIKNTNSSARLYIEMELLSTSLEYMIQAGEKFKNGNMTQAQCAVAINNTIGCLWNYIARQMPGPQKYTESTSSLNPLAIEIEKDSVKLRGEPSITDCLIRHIRVDLRNLSADFQSKILDHQKYLDRASAYIPLVSKNEILKIISHMFFVINSTELNVIKSTKLKVEKITTSFLQSTIFLKPSLIVMEQAGRDFESGKITETQCTDILNRTTKLLSNFIKKNGASSSSYPKALPSEQDVCLADEGSSAQIQYS